MILTDPAQPQIIQNLSDSMSNLRSSESPEGDESVPRSPVSPPPPPPPPSFSLTKPAPVRVHPIRSSPPVHRNAITSTSQIRANLQANNALGRNMKNLAQIPPLRQSITPLPGKKISSGNNSSGGGGHQHAHPLGPQRSNSTLTPRVAPMAAVSPVIDDGKLKNRAPSPDSPKLMLKRQSSCRDGEHGYESDYPVQ